jgi:hypothetical protein
MRGLRNISPVLAQIPDQCHCFVDELNPWFGLRIVPSSELRTDFCSS